MHPPTGQQHVIERGGVRAVVAELGASLRELSVEGIHLVQRYGDDGPPPLAAGIVLAPWPNRVADGRWLLDGAPQQLDITEVGNHNAIHGLLRNTGYRLAERSADSVTLTAEVFPQHGYPFHLQTSVRYQLTGDGIEVTHEAVNAGSASAPYAVGAHPFLCIGDVPTGELTLVVHAGQHIESDARLIPTGTGEVTGTEWDLRAGRPVAELDLDAGYTALRPGVSAVLRAPDGREVRLRQEHRYLQVFVTGKFPGVQHAVALEPMTAPANAFNTGTGLEWIEPQHSTRATWGVQYVV